MAVAIWLGSVLAARRGQSAGGNDVGGYIVHTGFEEVSMPTAGGGIDAAPIPALSEHVGLEVVALASPGRVLLKRAFDLVGGVLLSVLTLPIVLVLAGWSGATYRAWPFFTQKRIGRFGQHFTFIKVRSLPPETSAYALKHVLDQDELPWLARVMRTKHLDELPQLWLVVAGRMSLVGPRPKMPDDVEPVDPRYAYLRTRVPQGCTGLWQVSEHQGELPSDTPQYESLYLRSGGLRMDLWILWRTACQMLGAGKPVALEAVPSWAQSSGWVRDRTASETLAA